MIMELPKRKKMRLQGYDYSRAGAYFVTICTKNRQELLWDVGARIARPFFQPQPLSNYGHIIDDAIQNIALHYEMVNVDKYAIMPNHVHIILAICDNHGRAMRAPTVSTIINQMKGYSTKQIGISIWQKLFHDHIIRNEQEYQRIWRYIDENPVKWEDDCFFTK